MTAKVMVDVPFDSLDTIEVNVYCTCILNEWADRQIASDDLTTLP